MDAGDEESIQAKKAECRFADQRDVQITGPLTVPVERHEAVPAFASHRAAAQHHAGSVGNRFSQHAAKLLESMSVAAERELDDIVPFLLFSQAALHSKSCYK